jgi:ABC-2 type transport system permease protein
VSVGRTLRALPTLLRVGVAETVAYRAEFFVWILTTTLPLVMLALWTSVADEAPFRGFASADFVAYYLATLVVRNLTGTWVAWQLNEELRSGALALRLLRPIHPFVALMTSHAAAIPLRGLVAIPITVILLLSSGGAAVAHDPIHLLMLIPSLAMAWIITFALMFAIGCLAFFLTRAIALVDIYFGLFAVLSGYLLPLPLLPGWLRELAAWSPFAAMLSAPVRLMTGVGMSDGEALRLLGGQAAWTALAVGLALGLWRRGLRRFEGVGA